MAYERRQGDITDEDRAQWKAEDRARREERKSATTRRGKPVAPPPGSNFRQRYSHYYKQRMAESNRPAVDTSEPEEEVQQVAPPQPSNRTSVLRNKALAPRSNKPPNYKYHVITALTLAMLVKFASQGASAATKVSSKLAKPNG